MPIKFVEPVSGVPDMCYRVLVKSVDHKPSSKGQPMTTLNLQILAPESVTLPSGQVVDTAGIEGKLFMSFSDKAIGYTNRALRKLGVQVDQLAANSNTVPEYIQQVQDILTNLMGMTFEMRVTTEAAKPLKGANDQPMVDGAGNPVLGNPQTRFDHANIIGNRVPLSQLGA